MLTNGKKACCLVLGMHRTGTSALSGFLAKTGVYFSDNLLEPQKGVNDKGFFEHKGILSINEEILSFFNQKWYNIEQLPDNWLDNEILISYKEKIKDIIIREFSLCNIFGIKDPRLCLIYPIYLDVFHDMDIEPYLIITYRDKKHVTKSIIRRGDDFSERHIDSLYDKYINSIHKYKNGYNNIVIHYDDIVDNSEKIYLNILDFLYPYISFKFESIKEIEEFITPKLRHFK